jgi:hypothetical protein
MGGGVCLISLLICGLIAVVGQVTLKSNGDEALSDEFLLKSNGDEALKNFFYKK